MTASAAPEATASKRLYLFDTTLRDGAQTQGVDFSVQDKRMISEALDTLGIDYIEGGWPGATLLPRSHSRRRSAPGGATRRRVAS